MSSKILEKIVIFLNRSVNLFLSVVEPFERLAQLPVAVVLAVAVVVAALVEQVRLALVVVEPVVAELQPPAVVVMESVKMCLNLVWVNAAPVLGQFGTFSVKNRNFQNLSPGLNSQGGQTPKTFLKGEKPLKYPLKIQIFNICDFWPTLYISHFSHKP